MEKLLEKLNKLSLPAVILIASIILGGFIFATQVIKQQSIERQQEIKLQEDRCEALTAGVRDKWNNVMGVTYDNDFWQECVVTHTDPETGEVETSPLRFMKTVK